MEIFTTTKKFDVKPEKITHHKIIRYFRDYGFKLKHESENKYLFFKKRTLLEGWKMNPLNWESEVRVEIVEENLKITYKVEGLYITPLAFSRLYHTFLNKFENYIIKNDDYKIDNTTIIKKAKKELYMYYGFMLLTILLGIVLSSFLKNTLESEVLGTLVFISFIALTGKLLNNYLENKKYPI